MSDFTFPCPSCQQQIQASAEHAGMQVACPLCQATITIPAGPAPAPVAQAGVPMPKSKLQIAAAPPGEAKPQPTVPLAPPRKKKKKIDPAIVGEVALGVVIVVAAILFGPRLYHKYKAHKEAQEAAEEEALHPKPPPELTAAEITAKMTGKFKSLTGFSAHGKETAELDMSELAPNNPALKSVNLTADTAILIGRPDLYRLEWQVHSGAGGPPATGAAWCAGKGDYVSVGSPYPSKVRNRETALAQASEAAGTLGMALVQLFFDDKDAATLASTLAKTNSYDNLVNGQDCYVLTAAANAAQFELWIDKNSFLVPQIEVFLTGKLDDAAYQAETNSVVKAEMLRMSKIHGSIKETYDNLQENKAAEAADFAKPILSAGGS